MTVSPHYTEDEPEENTTQEIENESENVSEGVFRKKRGQS